MNKRSGFQRRKEQSRERIKRAASELFQTHGVKKTSLADIAERASVSPVTIYNHFGNKDGVVKAVFKDILDATIVSMLGVVEGDGSFPEKLEGLIFAKLAMLRDHGDTVVQAMSSSDPELRELIEHTTSQSTRAFMQLLAEGRQQGYIDPAISDRSVMLFIEMFREFSANHKLLTGDSEQDLRMSQELSTLFFYGIMGNRHIQVPEVGDRKEKA